MKNTILFLAGLLLAAGIYYYLTAKDRHSGPTVLDLPRVEDQESALPAPTKYPVAPPSTEANPLADAPDEAATPPEPLPTLDESDAMLAGAVGVLLDAERFGGLVKSESFIRFVVVTIDNLSAAKVPAKSRFYTPPPGEFLVRKGSGDADSAALDPANYQRYTRYVEMLESMDPDGVVKVYTHYYPLFQEAYESLGYPDRYFNDRLVEVIDTLLATPEIDEPVRLLQPAVLYTFADPRLEALSAGQKMLLRTGPENGGRLRMLLREYRRRLTTLAE